MTAKEFTRIQERLKLSDAELADQLEVNRATVWRWKNDKKIDKVTEMAMRYLELTYRIEDYVKPDATF